MNVFGMNDRSWRPATAFVLLAVSGLAVSGCMSSPTYGTDKTSTEQLVGDVSGILSLAPKKKIDIEYKPRPELVKPVKGEVANLPTPQDSLAVSSNPAWPESPEQKRARLRAEATLNRDNPGFKPEIVGDAVPVVASSTERTGTSSRFAESGLTPPGGKSIAQQGAVVKQQLAASRQVGDGKRRYLSDPPVEYRKPSETAPVGDVGEDEVKKERRLKAQARKGKSWTDLWPF